jgi:hypothetical protein
MSAAITAIQGSQGEQRMNRSTRIAAGIAGAVVLGLLLTTQVVSQEQDKKTPPGAGDMGQWAEMMAQWQKLNAKGPAHEQFTKMVGTWDAEMKMWMMPGMPPTTMPGTAEFRTILDGRYVEQVYRCDMGDGVFEGRGIEGYDTMTKQYVSIWMDNDSTGIFMMRGTPTADGKKIIYFGEMADPMSPGRVKIARAVAEERSDDEVVLSMYERGPDGEEYKNMEITYKRNK